MDGSAQPFIFLIECAGAAEQDRPRRWIEILKPVTVNAHGKSARLEPVGAELTVATSMARRRHFRSRLPDRVRPSPDQEPVLLPQLDAVQRFKSRISLAPAPSAFAERVEELWARGLALGGSLKNAVVVSHDKVLNEEGLRLRGRVRPP